MERSPQFVTTRWSVVVAARGGQGEAASAALETLCRTYWFPLYAYARRRGRDEASAEDSVQGFFAHLLAGEALERADPVRGRFRAYLLSSFKNYMSNEAAYQKAAKRGGGKPLLRIDSASSERHLAVDPSHEQTPERIFLRDWALTVLREVLGELRASYVERGKEALFDDLKEYLTPGARLPSYAEKAASLGMREGAVRVAVHRLRLRYRDRLRSAIADTVEAGEDEVDDEVHELIAVLKP